MSAVYTLVIDSGALIKRINLQEFSGHIVTIPEVIAEIKDKATRDYLALLPYSILTKIPGDEHIREVREFARKTGDLAALSVADLKLIALTRQLSCEANISVRSEPPQTGSWKLDNRYQDCANFPGFYVPKSEQGLSRSRQSSTTVTSVDTLVGDASDGDDMESRVDDFDIESGADLVASVPPSIREDSEVNFNNEEEDDEEGWITPETLGLAKVTLECNAGETDNDSTETGVSVACMTFDFAIQNVLLQLGLHILSPLKLWIKEARSYALRCAACFKITQGTEKRFCPNCGHKSLERVTVSTDSEGNKSYSLLRRRPFSMKGTRFSLPAPQGGKYARNPILIDHQPGAQQRASAKARERIDALDIDFVAKQSPFSLRDTTSRAAQLGFNSSNHFGSKAYWERRNPNAVVRKKK